MRKGYIKRQPGICWAVFLYYCAFKNIDFLLYNSLKYGSCKSLMKRIASPVDFISGPNCLSTSGNFEKENTGSLMAKPWSLRSILKSFSLFTPNITFVAMLMYGTSYALAMKGTVREALGLASITYTFSPLIANCILRSPFTFNAFANLIEYS